MAALPNTITIGDLDAPLFVFHNAEEGTNRDGIGSVGGVFAVDVIGDELSIDTVTAVVQAGRPPLPVSVTREIYLSPDGGVYISPENTFYYTEPTNEVSGQEGDVGAIPYGTPFRWECNGRLIASFYCLQPTRIGRWTWEINAVSGVGLLNNLDHKGGLYSGNRFDEVAAEIIGGAFPFTVAPALAEQAVYGWLPYDKRRANLHRLLIALGASMRRDENGEVAFVFLTVDSPTEVPVDRIDVNGSVDYDAPATRAEVTEHAFFVSPSVETEQLFDNSQSGSAAENTLVKFDGPMHSLTVSGTLRINESGVNYAVVSGVGTLTGKPYAHVTRIVAADAEAPAGMENVKHLQDDFTLVSLVNSTNVAKRILAYYSRARLVRARIKLLSERCGDVLSMSDPFYEPMTAFVQSLSVNASSNLLGYAELVENYLPAYQGNNISMSETLTGRGTWVSPFTGELTVVVISGGQGGRSGARGGDTPSTTVSSYSHTGALSWNQAKYIAAQNARAGKGGASGTPGEGGRVYVTTIHVTQGQGISYACGAGGAGEKYGTQTGGVRGTDTVFGAVSSASGTVSSSGYVNPISGELYALPGADGIAGNDGTGWLTRENGEPYLNIPDPVMVNGVAYANGSQGEMYHAGASGAAIGQIGWQAEGGFGGGAAYKASGNAGGRGSDNTDGRSFFDLYAARGGNGAAALPPPKAVGFGRGGSAGNGGGGGGAVGAGLKGSGDPSGYGRATTWLEQNNASSASASRINLNMYVYAAQGGAGSDGGEGADGAIILFRGG